MTEHMKITDEHKLCIEFAIGCAYRVLDQFEKKYPNDPRPRRALIAAQNFLDKPTKAAASASAASAAYAAYAAASSASASAAYAAYAAYAAASSASAAASSASATYAAYAASASAASAAAEKEWQCKFLFALNVKYKLNVKLFDREGKQ